MTHYNQKGYVGMSMSVRASKAYDSGQMPMSRWTKKAIIGQMIYEGFDDAVIAKAESMKSDDLRESALTEAGWHHTSRMANVTWFHKLDSERNVAISILSEDEYGELERRKAAEGIERMIAISRKREKGHYRVGQDRYCDPIELYDFEFVTVARFAFGDVGEFKEALRKEYEGRDD